MREREIERRLVQETKRRGGMCPKLVSPGTAGMPDRIVLLPVGRIGLVETKAPGQRPRPLQEAIHRRLRVLGFPVYVVDSPDGIDEALDAIEAGQPGQPDGTGRPDPTGRPDWH